jgi:lipopolysaccharide/colanic/teichoic acid biosynthesis glycosyltransferase
MWNHRNTQLRSGPAASDPLSSIGLASPRNVVRGLVPYFSQPLPRVAALATKRFIDIVGALVLIMLSLPVMLFAALVIKMTSRGPILFSRLDDGTPAMRVGKDGKPFPHCKFRTMAVGTHMLRYTELAGRNMREGSPLVKIKDDPRVTRIGAFLRKYSIDELPEFFLVLRGDMSLVGPRPHLPEEVARYEAWQLETLRVKPGITGLAQVSGRADLPFGREAELDIRYVRNWSLWSDIVILARTPLVVISGRGAY